MIGRRIERNLGCCPTCCRPSRSVFDYPLVLIQGYEDLPVPEAVDRFSGKARARLAARARATDAESIQLADDGINVTPEIAEMLAREDVRRYLATLKELIGQQVDPKWLQPNWKPHGYFERCHPVSETRLFLAVGEADESSPQQGVAHLEVLCEGINFGSAGGPTLQILGPIARILYRGILHSADDLAPEQPDNRQLTTDH